MPSQSTKSFMIGFSKSFTATMNLHCEFCGQVAPDYDFLIRRGPLAAMGARSALLAAWKRK
jgi:hypothetical protein